MKLEKQFIKKAIMGAVAVCVAAAVSLLLKNMLDANDPENALPQMSVTAGTVTIDPIRAGYEWNFITTTKRGPTVAVEDVPLIPKQVQAGVPITLSFSSKEEAVEIARMDGVPSGNSFLPVAGDLITPLQPGRYVYRVQVDFKKGYIVYYFAVEVI